MFYGKFDIDYCKTVNFCTKNSITQKNTFKGICVMYSADPVNVSDLFLCSIYKHNINTAIFN